jgi:NADH-quinone oxidoreductase subunit M
VAVQERVALFAGFAWALGIDGIALMLIMLSVFLMPICIGASHSIEKSASANTWRPSC